MCPELDWPESDFGLWTGLVQVAGHISLPFDRLELAKVAPKHKNNERPERERPD